MVNAPSVDGDDAASGSRSTTTSLQDTMSPLQLLQAYLKAQATRSGISNELVTAFSEPDITDAALQKVIEISSSGLLEVRAECEAVITLLSTRSDEMQESNESTAVRRMANECIAIERLEKDRISEETKRLQLLRIRRLNELAEDENTQESTAACMVEQHQNLANIKSATEISQRKSVATDSTRVANTLPLKSLS